MTEQVKDSVKINNIEYETYSYPLESWSGVIPRDRAVQYTSCYRGYRANWEIKDNSLILLKNPIQGFNHFSQSPVVATWFSGEIIIPGDIINEPNSILLASHTVLDSIPFPKFYTHYLFDQGILVSVRTELAPQFNKKWWNKFLMWFN